MAMTLLTTNSDTNQASMSFTSSIDSTYKLYIFKFYDINPATNDQYFTFNGSDDASSHSYDITKTTTVFSASHPEDNSSTNLTYNAGQDVVQGTGFQRLTGGQGNGADESVAGELFLFNPSNTTYVKHFYSTVSFYGENNQANNPYIAGYFNTTAAITALQFKFESGNFDGTIKMYGVA
jgi:hypothetical protein